MKNNPEYKKKYAGHFSKAEQGFTIVEMSVVFGLMAFLGLALSATAIGFSKQNKRFDDNLEMISRVQEVQNLLKDENRCSENLRNIPTRETYSIESLYALRANGTLNTNSAAFSTGTGSSRREFQVRIAFAPQAGAAGTGGVRETEVVIEKFNDKGEVDDTFTKKFPLYYQNRAGTVALDRCSTENLQEASADSTVCNAGNEGIIRYNFDIKDTEMCSGGAWVTTHTTAGSFVKTLTFARPCRIPNPYTKTCSCPAGGYSVLTVHHFVNYGCANGVYDTWPSLNDDGEVTREVEGTVQDNRCGIEVYLCSKG